MALRDLSGSLFIDLVAELRALDDPSMPVLIAVDQYNTWEVDSAYAYNGRRIPAKQLCVPYALNFLSPKKADAANWSMKNGFCIGELSDCTVYLCLGRCCAVGWRNTYNATHSSGVHEMLSTGMGVC